MMARRRNMVQRYVQDGTVLNAVVTGPTAGIGRAFAETFAKQGLGLVLVARDQDRLTDLAAELTARYGVGCEVMVADLADRSSLVKVEERAARPDVFALVNNAGFGLATGFTQNSLAAEQQLLDTLVTATMRLTHAALPQMMERDSGWIINVSSIAGWIAGGTYSAAKSWTTVFTEGLASELLGSRVRAIAVCPGFVRTEFHQRAAQDVSAIPEFWWLKPEQVVDQTFHDLARGRVLSVASLRYQGAALMLQTLPRPAIRSVSRLKRRFVRRSGVRLDQ
jgi:short-subunit dehydrogenase